MPIDIFFNIDKELPSQYRLFLINKWLVLMMVTSFTVLTFCILCLPSFVTITFIIMIISVFLFDLATHSSSFSLAYGSIYYHPKERNSWGVTQYFFLFQYSKTWIIMIVFTFRNNYLNRIYQESLPGQKYGNIFKFQK